MRGVIDVVALEPEIMTVEAVWNQFTGKLRFDRHLLKRRIYFHSLAQTCTFPFIFNSVSYTACTLANDTQLWCSPTPIYTGQRLYCIPTGMFVIQSEDKENNERDEISQLCILFLFFSSGA
jgi:hypothetical protein